MSAPLVIFAVGNPSRGDDALGPVICARLAELVVSRGLTDEIELIEDFQLNIEHALDLLGRRMALFIDAGENTPAPFLFSRLVPSREMGHSTHALSPECVLGVYEQTEGLAPPPAFLIGVRGECFGLGEPLSPAASRHMAAAQVFIDRLLDRRQPADWASLLAEHQR